MKKLKRFLLFTILSSFTILYLNTTRANLDYNINEKYHIYENGLTIHYLDVGQGDSIFIEFPNDEVMIIDSGEVEYYEKIENYIKNQGYEKLDYVVVTHPHTDHMGAMAKIIDSFEVGKIYMPKVTTTTRTYEDLLKTIANHNLKIKSALANDIILDEDNLKVEILAPFNHEYDNLNNYSIVLKITYKERKFLFMGDAENLLEKEIKADVSSDVIKVGHHGSNTSSGSDFVKRVNAKYAIISVGENNSYNHPNTNIIKRWEDSGAKVLRTDINGNIIISTDGIDLAIGCEKNESDN